MSYVNPTGGDHPREALAAYALDAVDGDERRAIESHLATCLSCRRELAVHEEVLSRMIVDERPPAAVWDRIVQETRPEAAPLAPGPDLDHEPSPHAGAAPVADFESARHRRDGRQARPPRRFARALAAAAAVVAVAGVGVAVVGEMGGGDDPAPEVAIGTIESDVGSEIAVVTQGEDGTQVEFTDADALPEDRTYQFWSTDGDEPVSLGLLGTGGDREVEVSLPEGTTQVAISNEPAGGSPAPTLVVGQGEVTVPA